MQPTWAQTQLPERNTQFIGPLLPSSASEIDPIVSARLASAQANVLISKEKENRINNTNYNQFKENLKAVALESVELAKKTALKDSSDIDQDQNMDESVYDAQSDKEDQDAISESINIEKLREEAKSQFKKIMLFGLEKVETKKDDGTTETSYLIKEEISDQKSTDADIVNKFKEILVSLVETLDKTSLIEFSKDPDILNALTANSDNSIPWVQVAKAWSTIVKPKINSKAEGQVVPESRVTRLTAAQILDRDAVFNELRNGLVDICPTPEALEKMLKDKLDIQAKLLTDYEQLSAINYDQIKIDNKYELSQLIRVSQLNENFKLLVEGKEITSNSSTLEMKDLQNLISVNILANSSKIIELNTKTSQKIRSIAELSKGEVADGSAPGKTTLKFQVKKSDGTLADELISFSPRALEILNIHLKDLYDSKLLKNHKDSITILGESSTHDEKLSKAKAEIKLATAEMVNLMDCHNHAVTAMNEFNPATVEGVTGTRNHLVEIRDQLGLVPVGPVLPASSTK